MSASELRNALPPAGDLTTIEAFIRTLSCHASIGIFLSDPQGHTLYINDRLRHIAGLPTTSKPGECWLDALFPDDHGTIYTEWSRATTEGRSFSRELRFQRADGSVRWVMAEAFPLRPDGKSVSGYVGMIRDVTPRQLALEALQASEERYRSLIQLLPHAILVHSGGAILFVNEACIRLLGIAATQGLGGQPLSEFFPDEFLRNLPPSSEPLTKPTPLVERRFARPDGSVVDVEMVAAPVTFDGHSAVQVILTDITAQKETAAKLHHARKMEAIATLAGGIAHEFNNCLTAILGFSDLALPTLLPDSRAHGHVLQVILATKRAGDLVMQMLVFGRQAESAKQPISLDILLKETLRILKRQVPDNISIREWVHSAISPVLADPTQIHQVCVGLLAHSQQAMSETGGILEVRLDNVRLGDAANGQDLPLSPGQYVHLTVSYTGEGMSSDLQARLSDSFFTTDSARNGTGMGLAAVQSIVSEHGGTIRATSTVGHGTTIDVYLPAMLHPNSVVLSEPAQERDTNLARLKESLAQINKER